MYSLTGTSNWNALPDVVSANPAEINQTIQTTQELDAGQKYVYQIFAYDGTGLSPGSEKVSPETPVDFAVQLSATATVVQTTQLAVNLTWKPISPFSPSWDQTRRFWVYARPANGTQPAWQLRDTLPGTASSFADVVTNQEWEYRVDRWRWGDDLHSNTTDFGYAIVGAEDPLPSARGTVLLVVDQTQLNAGSVGAANALAMSNDLLRLKNDLIGDGWSVQRIDVARDDDNVSVRNGVVDVKAQILAVHAAHPDLKSIFIIGHVPVPYSGIATSFDGHGDHNGAWSTDLYYGDMDGNWTDQGYPDGDDSAGQISITGMKFAENNNVPSDGKFDWSVLPPQPNGSSGKIEVAVGRVDLSRLYWLAPDGVTSISESVLLQRYLDKNHAFRQGSHDFLPLDANGNVLPNKALIDDQFGPGILDTIPPWGDFSALVGAENVTSVNWNTALRSTDPSSRYLWAYGAGPGAVSDRPDLLYLGKVEGVARSYDYSGHAPFDGQSDPIPGDTQYQAVFNVIFGSWVGDWNYPKSILRAAVASKGIGLASIWGRPPWILHPMSVGGTLGDALMITINSTNSMYDSYPRVVFTTPAICLDLMGDPTLRMSYTPQTAWVWSQAGEDTTSFQSDFAGDERSYQLYRATTPDGPFTLVGGSFNDPQFQDDAAPNSSVQTWYYMVRVQGTQQTPTGSYDNLSTGVILAVPNPAYLGPHPDTYNLYRGN